MSGSQQWQGCPTQQQSPRFLLGLGSATAVELGDCVSLPANKLLLLIIMQRTLEWEGQRQGGVRRGCDHQQEAGWRSGGLP